MNETIRAQHYPINAPADADEDWRRCACGADLYSQAVCDDAEYAACGCPLYLVQGGEHWPHS